MNWVRQIIIFLLPTGRGPHNVCIGRKPQQNRIAYLPTTLGECFCPAKKYSMTIAKATVVRLRVVYMGTFMARTDSIVTNFYQKRRGRHVLK